MAGSVNRVILVGNLGKDAEVISGRNGKFAKLSIATSESWKDKASGERKESTEWHNIVVFNEALVKVCEDYLSAGKGKGKKVYVEGQQKTRTWEKDGDKRYTTETVLTGFGCTLQILTPSGTGGARDASPDDYGTQSSRDRSEPPNGGRSVTSDPDEQIPF